MPLFERLSYQVSENQHSNENASVRVGCTMDHLGGAQRTGHRLVAAGKYGHVAVRKVADHTRITLRQSERHIAANRRDTEQIEVVR